MNSLRIIIAGGSGFLGQVLWTHFTAQGAEVVVLTRSPRSANDSRSSFALKRS